MSSWFQDYVYVPLGGNRGSFLRTLFNLLITFLISGLWHGASWNFVIWGLIHGIYLIVYKNVESFLSPFAYKNTLSKIINILVTFFLVTLAWIFFRANNITDAIYVLKGILTSKGEIFTGSGTVMLLSITSLLILITKSIKDEFHIPIKILNNSHLSIRLISFIILTCYILLFGALDSHQFIYFQF